MIKVLYVLPTLERGGPTNVFYYFIKYLDRTKYLPIILTIAKEKTNSRYNDFKNLEIEIYCANTTKYDWFNLGCFKFKNKINKIDANVIHSVGIKPDILTALFSNKNVTKITSVVNNPFEDYLMSYGKITGTIMTTILKLIIPKFNYAIACSQDVKEKVAAKGMRVSGVIYNGIETENNISPNDETKQKLFQEIAIPTNATIFIFSGYMQNRKLPHIAIEAFNLFEKEYPNTVLLILGDGPEINTYKNIAKTKKIKFLGFVNNQANYFFISDYYIATSSAEGLPTAVLEAMNMGLPVVLSNIKPHQEILASNKMAGELAMVNNAQDTYEAMCRIVNSSRAERSKAAKEIVQQKFSAQKVSLKYQELYS